MLNFDEKTEFYYLKDFPLPLKNKIKILITASKRFEIPSWEEMLQLYKENETLREKEEQVQQIKKSDFKAAPNTLNMVKLSKFFFGKNFSILFLSNGNLQVVFEDQLEIFFCRDSQSVSITKNDDININYSINNFLIIDNDDLWKRIWYVNKVIKSIQEKQFGVDLKSSKNFV